MKKQGILALTFANASDYDKIQTGDRVNIKGVTELAPGKQLELEVVKPDGTKVGGIGLNHTFNDEQVKWFKAGSCLNYIKSNLV